MKPCTDGATRCCKKIAALLVVLMQLSNLPGSYTVAIHEDAKMSRYDFPISSIMSTILLGTGGASGESHYGR